MEYLPLSFFAGILTILAPCVLPVFPVIFGSSIKESKNTKRPLVVTLSLAASIVVFTLLLKASTLLIAVDPRIWNIVSGAIVMVFGIFSLFPNIWSWIEIHLKLNQLSGNLLQNSAKRNGLLGDILIGASLGPVFASCSPTYGLIVAFILPKSFFVGLLNLIAYAAGLSAILLVLSVLGQKALVRVKWAVNPYGMFKKVLGIIFIVLGIAIGSGFIKQVETALIDAGFADFTKIETQIIKRIQED